MNRVRLTDDQFAAIANDLKSGKSTVEVGKAHGISRHTAYRIKKAIDKVVRERDAKRELVQQ
jgi:hypothetical protein